MSTGPEITHDIIPGITTVGVPREQVEAIAADLGVGPEPHQAEILVEWWPSASIGEPRAVRHLLEGWCGQLMEQLQAFGVTDPCISLNAHREPQWLLNAIDLDRVAVRSFAMRDIQSWDEFTPPDHPQENTE